MDDGRRALFVAGSHTDVGKTHVACAVIGAARARGWAVDALKPVVSGFAAEAGEPGGWAPSDPGRLLAALGKAPTGEALHALSPWRFAAPLAPQMAARLEGRDLRLAPIVAFCRSRIAASAADLMVVEGVGGLMSPIAEDATGLDLMEALGLPALLVTGSYLGAISHALTALEVLRARSLKVTALVVSQSRDPLDPDFAATAQAVAAFAAPTLVLRAPLGAASAWAGPILAAMG